MSDFFDMTSHELERESIAREHKRRREHETQLETLEMGSLLFVGALVILLYLVMR